jgi:hypothetical protein
MLRLPADQITVCTNIFAGVFILPLEVHVFYAILYVHPSRTGNLRNTVLGDLRLVWTQKKPRTIASSELRTEKLKNTLHCRSKVGLDAEKPANAKKLR